MTSSSAIFTSATVVVSKDAERLLGDKWRGIIEEADEELNLSVVFKKKTYTVEGQWGNIIQLHNIIRSQLDMIDDAEPEDRQDSGRDLMRSNLMGHSPSISELGVRDRNNTQQEQYEGFKGSLQGLSVVNKEQNYVKGSGVNGRILGDVKQANVKQGHSTDSGDYVYCEDTEQKTGVDHKSCDDVIDVSINDTKDELLTETEPPVSHNLERQVSNSSMPSLEPVTVVDGDIDNEKDDDDVINIELYAKEENGTNIVEYKGITGMTEERREYKDTTNNSDMAHDEEPKLDLQNLSDSEEEIDNANQQQNTHNSIDVSELSLRSDDFNMTDENLPDDVQTSLACLEKEYVAAKDTSQYHSRELNEMGHTRSSKDSEQPGRRKWDIKGHTITKDTEQHHSRKWDEKEHTAGKDTGQPHSRKWDEKEHTTGKDTGQPHSRKWDEKEHTTGKDTEQPHSRKWDEKEHTTGKDTGQPHSRKWDEKEHTTGKDTGQPHSRKWDEKEHTTGKDTGQPHSRKWDEKEHTTGKDTGQPHSRKWDEKEHTTGKDTGQPHSRKWDEKEHTTGKDTGQPHSRKWDEKEHTTGKDTEQPHSRKWDEKEHTAGKDTGQSHSRKWDDKGHTTGKDTGHPHSRKLDDKLHTTGEDTEQPHSKKWDEKENLTKNDFAQPHDKEWDDTNGEITGKNDRKFQSYSDRSFDMFVGADSRSVDVKKKDIFEERINADKDRKVPYDGEVCEQYVDGIKWMYLRKAYEKDLRSIEHMYDVSFECEGDDSNEFQMVTIRAKSAKANTKIASQAFVELETRTQQECYNQIVKIAKNVRTAKCTEGAHQLSNIFPEIIIQANPKNPREYFIIGKYEIATEASKYFKEAIGMIPPFSKPHDKTYIMGEYDESENDFDHRRHRIKDDMKFEFNISDDETDFRKPPVGHHHDYTVVYKGKPQSSDGKHAENKITRSSEEKELKMSARSSRIETEKSERDSKESSYMCLHTDKVKRSHEANDVSEYESFTKATNKVHMKDENVIGNEKPKVRKEKMYEKSPTTDGREQRTNFNFEEEENDETITFSKSSLQPQSKQDVTTEIKQENKRANENLRMEGSRSHSIPAEEGIPNFRESTKEHSTRDGNSTIKDTVKAKATYSFNLDKEIQSIKLSKQQFPTIQLLYELLDTSNPGSDTEEFINEILSGNQDTGLDLFPEPIGNTSPEPFGSTSPVPSPKGKASYGLYDDDSEDDDTGSHDGEILSSKSSVNSNNSFMAMNKLSVSCATPGDHHQKQHHNNSNLKKHSKDLQTNSDIKYEEEESLRYSSDDIQRSVSPTDNLVEAMKRVSIKEDRRPEGNLTLGNVPPTGTVMSKSFFGEEPSEEPSSIHSGSSAGDNDEETAEPLPVKRAVYQPPDGVMHRMIDKKYHLPGHEGEGTQLVTFSFDDGRQQDDGQQPRERYKGSHITSVISNGQVGKAVYKLLKDAFDQRKLFTIETIDGDKCVIPRVTFKADKKDYPDPMYLYRLKVTLQQMLNKQ